MIDSKYREQHAMPDPLSRVVPNASLSIYAEVAERHSDRAAQVAGIFARWIAVEVQFGIAFGFSMGAPNIKQTVALFYSQNSFDGQLRMIQKIFERMYDFDDVKIFTALRNAVVKPVQKERNRLAHWAWAECTELPNAVCLIDPEDLTQFYMGVFYNINQKDSSIVKIDTSRVLVYRDADLVRIREDIVHVHSTVRSFVSLCLADLEARDRARVQLRSVPQIQNYLSREASKNEKQIQ